MCEDKGNSFHRHIHTFTLLGLCQSRALTLKVLSVLLRFKYLCISFFDGTRVGDEGPSKPFGVNLILYPHPFSSLHLLPVMKHFTWNNDFLYLAIQCPMFKKLNRGNFNFNYGFRWFKYYGLLTLSTSIKPYFEAFILHDSVKRNNVSITISVL